MSFSPVVRFRNFTLDNFKVFLEVYPDMMKSISRAEAADMIEGKFPGYKRTAYQQACQLGLEDRSSNGFRIQRYLYTFEDENLLKYLQFWFKTYYAPNPYVRSDDVPILIYCELAKEILGAESRSINYSEFFSNYINGKNSDILLNIIKEYGSPVKYKKENGEDILYVEEESVAALREEIEFIKTNFPVGNADSREEFFERYTFPNYCKFYGIEGTLPESEEAICAETFDAVRKTGGYNCLFYGVPGSGKSYMINEICSDQNFMERVVFHPDYTYSDFTGQILPRLKKQEDGEEKLEYAFVPGPFTRILKKAYENRDKMYYLIIEEINRGNAPAVFGEIFQLLDRKDEKKYPAGEVGESIYGITNYEIARYVYNDEEHMVRIPSNLSILATMNTSDQNIFTMDTAFQRRWEMQHIPNMFRDSHGTDIIEGSKIPWGAFTVTINDILVESNKNYMSDDKRLGAYFATEKELSADRFPEKVLKYLWDDGAKMDRTAIFDDRFSCLDEVFEAYASAETDRLEAVLNESVYGKMLSSGNEKE